jgi:putative tricarboxylic transport membrane protein
VRRFDLVGVAPYAVILIISGYLYYQALQISTAGPERLGADVWPKTILLFAILTCVWEIVRKVWLANHIDTKHGDSRDVSLVPQTKRVEDSSEVGPLVPWIGIGLTAAYVFSFPWLGYFLATFFYVTAFVYVGNYRKLFAAACVGVAASLAFMFLFMRVVYVSLPIGVEPFAQVSTFLLRTMGIK